MEMLFFVHPFEKINLITIASQSQINRTHSAIAIIRHDMRLFLLRLRLSKIAAMRCDCDCDAIGTPAFGDTSLRTS